MKKYHIGPNAVQETPVIPLLGRKVCSERCPELFHDPGAARLFLSPSTLLAGVK